MSDLVKELRVKAHELLLVADSQSGVQAAASRMWAKECERNADCLSLVEEVWENEIESTGGLEYRAKIYEHAQATLAMAKAAEGFTQMMGMMGSHAMKGERK